MSKESLEHLNTQTLIGFTDKRGTAWHYRADQQGDEPNHYPGAIPVPDVQRRLFGWQAQSRPGAVQTPATVETMTHLHEETEAVMRRRSPTLAGASDVCAETSCPRGRGQID